MLKARPCVQSLREYHPPLGNRRGLRLDFNENTVGCSPRVLQKLRELDSEDLARYPAREPAERVVAQSLAIHPEELLLTNGTDEAIHLVCEAYLEPQDEVLIAVPTFAMFEIYAAATGAKVMAIPSPADFRFPTEEVLARVTSRTKLIAVANPNNPTGAAVPTQDLLRIANAAPEAALLVDEAYFEFHGETVMGEWRSLPNLFVSRTFSKAYGLAGLRIGVLAGEATQMQMVRRVSSPYSVNSAALLVLPTALADRGFIEEYVLQAVSGRDQLQQALKTWGIKFWASRANFVLMHLAEKARQFVVAMRARGILVRDRSTDYGCEGCVRITLGSSEHNQQLMNALDSVVEELGLREKVQR